MTDTPDEIYKIQLELWLSKTPAERLKRTLQDNDDLYKFWNYFKDKQAASGNNNPHPDSK